MPVLLPSEYDARYYEGKTQSYCHNAGYSEYWRMRSFNEFQARMILDRSKMTGKVLEIGCACGYALELLVKKGIDARGIDVSPFAISRVSKTIKDRVEIAEALAFLQAAPTDSFDWIYSIWFLECQTDEELKALIPEMNRVAKKQIHITNPTTNRTFYNGKTLAAWRKLGFKNTIII